MTMTTMMMATLTMKSRRSKRLPSQLRNHRATREDSHLLTTTMRMMTTLIRKKKRLKRLQSPKLNLRSKEDSHSTQRR